jgi:hypothetical protein
MSETQRTVECVAAVPQFTAPDVVRTTVPAALLGTVWWLVGAAIRKFA